jgi:predicted DNA-binding antitoxin AbrB/MazE fold protein
MSGTVRARFKAGVLELLDRVDLSEGAEVSVTIIESATKEGKSGESGESMRDALKATAGAWKDLIDAEALKRNIYKDRLIDTRPVPKL